MQNLLVLQIQLYIEVLSLYPGPHVSYLLRVDVNCEYNNKWAAIINNAVLRSICDHAVVDLTNL